MPGELLWIKSKQLRIRPLIHSIFPHSH